MVLGGRNKAAQVCCYWNRRWRLDERRPCQCCCRGNWKPSGPAMTSLPRSTTMEATCNKSSGPESLLSPRFPKPQTPRARLPARKEPPPPPLFLTMSDQGDDDSPRMWSPFRGNAGGNQYGCTQTYEALYDRLANEWIPVSSSSCSKTERRRSRRRSSPVRPPSSTLIAAPRN